MGRAPRTVIIAVLVSLVGLPAVAADDHSVSITALVARVIPSVVSITTMRALPAPSDPLQASMAQSVLQAEGSGFIVDPSGYIATNRHVVDGAYDIAVTLSEGRTVEAKLVWASPVVDVAFLKIEVGHKLPAVSLASDQDLRLGEHVVAIGNPLGLGTSVSAGIVSGLNRNIKQSPYDAFIQTDAAINHGSSGGPLFNEAGDVVGMNTALYASVANGGSEGLGFAIPGADLSFLIDQLKHNGHVKVGWLGVHGQKVTAAMSDALEFPGANGVIVASVVENSPAARAGLRRGDILETFDTTILSDVTTLNRAVGHAMGKTVALGVWRDGKPATISATIVEASEPNSGLTEQTAVAAPRFSDANDLGMVLSPINDDLRVRYALPPDLQGLVVTGVTAASEAGSAGLRPGDVLLSVQMTPVSSGASFDAMLAQYAKTGHRHVIVLVQSSGGERWVTLPASL